jgi:hypothetical protein
VDNTEAIHRPSDGFIISHDQKDDIQTMGQNITSEDEPQMHTVANGANLRLNVVHRQRTRPIYP